MGAVASRRWLPVAGALCLFVLAACGGQTVDRAEWEGMPREDRVLYVQSLIGAEKAKDAKGGGGREISRSAESYVDAIDAAYARGDRREVHEVFGELQ